MNANQQLATELTAAHPQTLDAKHELFGNTSLSDIDHEGGISIPVGTLPLPDNENRKFLETTHFTKAQIEEMLRNQVISVGNGGYTKPKVDVKKKKSIKKAAARSRKINRKK